LRTHGPDAPVRAVSGTRGPQLRPAEGGWPQAGLPEGSSDLPERSHKSEGAAPSRRPLLCWSVRVGSDQAALSVIAAATLGSGSRST